MEALVTFVPALKLHVVQKAFLPFLALLLLLATARTASASMTSTNWAGYAITSNDVTGINASWNIPKIQCANTVGGNTVTQGLSVWIGFDGLSTNVIPEQVGTVSSCLNGSPGYWSWEEDPTTGAGQANHSVIALSEELSAGDHITATIAYQGNNHFQLKIADSDVTDSRTFNVIITNAPRLSAEWIVEAFTNVNTQAQVTLPSFQPITLSDCSATVNNAAESITQLNGKPISMVDSNGKIIAATQDLNQAGTSFEVTELASPVPETPSVIGVLLPALMAAIFALRRTRLTKETKKNT
jgi:hypothetical protein